MQPKREILQIADMPKWKKSKALNDYLNFINNLNDSVKGSKLTDEIPISKMVQNVLILLQKLSTWVDEIPPIQQPQRFGNKAFRTWFNKLKENAKILIIECLENEIFSSYADEISFYLIDSFGNETRIDYGTGHEMTFLMFLMGFFKIGALKVEDSKSTVLKIIYQYLILVRKLQTTYNMEPAGSHGVWSLDDYQFLPFIFGSAQLLNQQKIEPQNFVDESYIEMYQNEYLFFSCLKFITTVKHGPFAEHSNQLWNISSVQTWSKVNSGLIKMYIAEVLEKFPVVQHILFGTLIDISPL